MLADTLRRSGQKSGIKVHVDSFTKQTATGNQDIPLPADIVSAMNAGPYAIKFWTAGSDQVSGVWDSTIWASLGFVGKDVSDSLTQYAVGASSADGEAVSNAARRMAAVCISLAHQNATGAQCEASFVGTQGATAMRINWSVNDAPTSVINYMIVAGLTNSKVVTWTTPTASGSKTVIGVGFQSDFVLHAGNLIDNPIPVSLPYAGGLHFGAMNKHGQQWANTFASGDGYSPSATSRWQQTDATILYTSEGEDDRFQASFSSMDADGFTTYFSLTDTTARRVISLCMEGVSSKIGAFTKNITTGAQTVPSRQGFVPKGLLFTNVDLPPYATPLSEAMWALGATDLVNQRVVGLCDIDARNPTNADSIWYSGSSLMNPEAGADPYTLGLASVTGVDEDDFILNWAMGNTTQHEHLYCLIGDEGVDTFPAMHLDTNLTGSHATGGFSNQKTETTLSTGRMVIACKTTTPTGYMKWSDDGQTWTDLTNSAISGWSNGSIDSYVDSGGNERLVVVWKQSGTGGGRTDGYLYAMVGTFNGDKTSITWGTALHIGNAGDGDRNYPDMVAFAEGTGGKVWAASSFTNGSNLHYLDMFELTITAAGAISGTFAAGGSSGTSAIHLFPSICIDPATKRLHVVWSAGGTGAGKGIRYRTASYSGGAWTWAAEVEVDNDRYIETIGDQGIVCLWDTDRSVVVIVSVVRNATDNRLIIYDSTSFTAFTNRASLQLTAPTNLHLYGMGAVINPTTGDIYVFGGQYVTTYRNVSYYKVTRTGVTLSIGSPPLVTDSFISVDRPHVNAFPITGGIGWVYTRGNNAPYAVAFDRILF